MIPRWRAKRAPCPSTLSRQQFASVAFWRSGGSCRQFGRCDGAGHRRLRRDRRLSYDLSDTSGPKRSATTRAGDVMRTLVGLVLVAIVAAAPMVEASAQTPDPAKWADLQAKAKAEGQVVVMGPPAAGLRSGLMTAFKNRYGI